MAGNHTDGDASSRMAGQQAAEQPSPAGSDPSPPQEPGAPSPDPSPSSQEGAAAATRSTRPRSADMEALWQLLADFDRRGIHVPVISILRARARRESETVGHDDGGAAYGNGSFGAVPASSEAIASLPETTVAEAAGNKDECSVCFESYREGDRLRTLPCSHGFHKDCILKWLGISRLCPLCRFALHQAEA